MAVVSGTLAAAGALGALGVGAAGAAGAGLGALGGALGSIGGGAMGLVSTAAKWLDTPEGKALANIVGAEKAAELKREQLRKAQEEKGRDREFAVSQQERQFKESAKSRAAQAEQAALSRGASQEEAKRHREFIEQQALTDWKERKSESEKSRLFSGGESEKGREFIRTEGAGARKRGQELLEGAEKGLMEETSKPLPELQEYQKQLREGTAEDVQRLTGETRAELAKTGVRGAQRGRLLSRGIGTYRKGRERDLGRMALEEAQRRKETRVGFLKQKALTGVGRSV